jgi:aldehyde dehydrogenase (NAD+)
MVQAVLDTTSHATVDDVQPQCFIAGRWITGAGAQGVSTNPTTGEPIGVFTFATIDQVDNATQAARQAFDRGPWQQVSHKARAALLRDLSARMANARDQLVAITIKEVGTPLAMTRAGQIQGAIDAIDWFADAAERGPDGWYERSLLPHYGGNVPPSSSVLIREPVGVVAAMPTWNFPHTNIVWKVCAALAAGCTVVMQPSPKATFSSVAFWRLLTELDLPPGVINMVLGDVDVGQRLSSSPDVDLVSFTGSVGVGAHIMAQAAPTLKKVVLELGGKSANIILPEADLGEVVKPSIDRWIGNAGQRCGATTRILVHSSQAEEFARRADAYIKGLTIGDPADPATDLGPLIDHGHRASVQSHIDRAIAEGGRIVAGGGDALPAGLSGAFMVPCLIGGLTNNSALCQQEQFGPVAALLTYDSVEEAVAIANETRFGLNAMVFGPTAPALAVARQLRCGTVTVNGRAASRREAPWGGYGQSGVGREGGDEGFREFFEIKHVQWAMR